MKLKVKVKNVTIPNIFSMVKLKYYVESQEILIKGV